MDYSLTLFNSIYDNKTEKRMDFSSWEQLEKLLYSLSEVPRAGKKDAQLISPAIYESDTTRANKNVICWAGWAAIDVDDHKFEGDLENELRNNYGDWYYVCYSTASSQVSQPKFRLVFPLKGQVEVSRIKHFWFALNTEFDFLGDRQTKDLSRMYYIPGCYDNSHNFIFTNPGQFIDPEALMSKHKFLSNDKPGATFFDRLPEEVQKAIVQHRKDQMENRNINWSSYKDCPFVNKSLIGEYHTINETGWYHKMYQIMVSIAANAVRKQYPITPKEIAVLCREIDSDTGNWYENRPLEKEAERAIEYVYTSNIS